MGQQEVHEYEALGGGSGRRLYCWLTSFSQSLQTNLRITLDSTFYLNYSTTGYCKQAKILCTKEKGEETNPRSFQSKHIFNRNDKSEHTTHLDNVVRIIIVWSEWRDLNSRPLDPQSSALPTALHPDILFCCASRGQLVYINTAY